MARLPTRKAPYSELCKKAEKFADYPFDKLAEIVPIVGDIIGFIGKAFNSMAARVVCGGSTEPPDIRGEIDRVRRDNHGEGSRAGYYYSASR